MIIAVLGSIVFGLATPTEAAAVGAFGGLSLAGVYATGGVRRNRRQCRLDDAVGPGRHHQGISFLTAKTSAMVCWLFVGSSDLLGFVRAAGRPGRSSSAGCCRSG
jgi:TRAP-type mannitol/chloroaromatic compound transport system permease large subunit